MISREDIIALCGLSLDEVLALAEHEHIPTMAATNLAAHLLSQKDGCQEIRRMIIADIAAARTRGDLGHLADLRRTLKSFVGAHPEADGGH